MRRYSLRGLVSAFFLFLFYSNLFAGEFYVAPQNYSTQKGTTGGQAVASLAIQDQEGSQDDWDHYLEFYTPSTLYQGQRSYLIPSQYDLSQLQSLDLRVNYRGPEKSWQVWTWKIYNWVSRQWIVIGDNSFARPWIWQMANFQLSGNLSDYISPNREVKILFQSNNAKDDANLDYEVLVLGLPEILSEPKALPEYWIPPQVSSWQWQFAGLPIDTEVDAQIYSLDLFDTDAALVQNLQAQGKKVVCYINMGAWENWRPDAKQFPASIKGRSNGWAGERWMDIRNLEVLMPILNARLDLCKAKGFDAVEPDNIDGYANRSGFPLTYAEQKTFNEAIAAAAHERNLAIGLKNDLNQVLDLVDVYDFAINESCFDYNECHLLNPFIDAGKAVFNVEYNLSTDQFCPQANAMNFNSMKKNRNLDGYREACR